MPPGMKFFWRSSKISEHQISNQIDFIKDRFLQITQ